MKPVKHLKVRKGMKISELVEEMGEIGFGARKISQASEILKSMVKDKECKVFFGIAGAMVPGGMKEAIMQMLDFTHIFVTTGANLTHDLMESIGEKHYIGEENVDDKKLHDQGIDRIYNVYLKNTVYVKLEKFFEDNWGEISKTKTIKELLWKLGELAPSPGILKKCWEKKIPIFCPAIADSGIGLMIWGRKAAGKKIEVDAFEDMKEIIDFAWTSKKSGVIYVGGGVPKNFIQQSLQFSKGADYGIQISTDRPEPGGSSGAPLKEGISWGKMNEKAKFIDVFCDATIALPLILGSL
jgi:deoxyhypusine synthase